MTNSHAATAAVAPEAKHAPRPKRSGVALPPNEQHTYRPASWRKAAGDMAKSTYYDLPDEMKPFCVRIGRRVLILESPREWAERVGERSA